MKAEVPFALPAARYRDLVRRALEEDIGSGDVSSEATIETAARARGVFLVRAPCVVAGLDVALEAFRQLEPGVQVSIRRCDGERCVPPEEIAEVVGLARTLLAAERTALNFLQRLSGIATRTRQFVDAAAGRITVLDTRKTTPTLRVLEKYAVIVGGGRNHRFGLDDAILIKDNHVRLAGGVAAAVARAREHQPGLSIEIEAQTLGEVENAAAAGVDVVLADNMTVEQIQEAVKLTRGRAKLEISGRVTLERMGELAMTGAEYVSVGGLTHSAPAVDISFEIEPA